MRQSWNSLSDLQKSYFKAFHANGYGTRFTGWILKKLGLEKKIGVKAYLYHDFAFYRGGTINDFIRSNIYLLLHATIHLLDGKYKWTSTLFFMIIIFIFYTIVSTIGIMLFRWSYFRKEKYRQVPSDDIISELNKI